MCTICAYNTRKAAQCFRTHYACWFTISTPKTISTVRKTSTAVAHDTRSRCEYFMYSTLIIVIIITYWLLYTYYNNVTYISRYTFICSPLRFVGTTVISLRALAVFSYEHLHKKRKKNTKRYGGGVLKRFVLIYMYNTCIMV